MISEEKAKEIIIQDVYKRLDAMGYGKKTEKFGSVCYVVKGNEMTVSEYQNYCILMELKKFGLK